MAQSTVNPGHGEGSCTWDASANGQTLDSNVSFVAPKEGMLGKQCEAQLFYSWVGNAGDLKVEIEESIDGTQAMVDLTPTLANEWRFDTISWPCDAGESYKLQVEATADAAILKYDQAYWGSPLQEIQISDASLVAIVEHPAANSPDFLIKFFHSNSSLSFTE